MVAAHTARQHPQRPIESHTVSTQQSLSRVGTETESTLPAECLYPWFLCHYHCSAVEVYKKSIKLPYYNPFSDDPRCEEYPDFKYCVDLVNGPVRESVFETEFHRYINNLNKEQEDKEDEPKKKVSVLAIVIIGVASVTVITIVGVIIYKRKKKYSL